MWGVKRPGFRNSVIQRGVNFFYVIVLRNIRHLREGRCPTDMTYHHPVCFASTPPGPPRCIESSVRRLTLTTPLALQAPLLRQEGNVPGSLFLLSCCNPVNPVNPVNHVLVFLGGLGVLGGSIIVFFFLASWRHGGQFSGFRKEKAGFQPAFKDQRGAFYAAFATASFFAPF